MRRLDETGHFATGAIRQSLFEITMETCEIVLADDHPIVREAIKILIETNQSLKVVGEANDGLQLLSILQKITPNIVIVDLQMPKMMGSEAIWEIKKLYPEIKSIILSGLLDDENTTRALSSGACAIISKACMGQELLAAIETVWKGGVYVSPDVINSGIEKIFVDTEQGNDLTHREEQIIKLVAEGLTSKKVSKLIGISPRTVDKHRAHIMEKLHLRNMVELVRYAFKKGFIHLD